MGLWKTFFEESWEPTNWSLNKAVSLPIVDDECGGLKSDKRVLGDDDNVNSFSGTGWPISSNINAMYCGMIDP